MDFVYKVFKFLGSLKAAVFVLLALATISAIGTFVESRYDAEMAKSLVYLSPWMTVTMFFFCVTVIFSAVDRLPWKKKHIPFLVAHLGLLILVAGSAITQKLGIDGTISIPVDGKSRMVSLSEKDLIVYTTMDGDNYTSLYQREVNFIKNPPQKDKVVIPLPNESIEVIEFHPFALRKGGIVRSEKKNDPPALRFQLKNDRVSQANWMFLKKPTQEMTMGLVKIIFTKDDNLKIPEDSNVLLFRVKDGELSYKLIYKDKRKSKENVIKLGDEVDTDWMDLKLRILSFYPNAKEKIDYEIREIPTGLTSPVIKVKYKGEENWLGLNSIIKFYTDSAAYILSYGNRQFNLGFDVKLKEFQMGKYPGTMRAASYASLVEVDGIGEQLISMNEPLKHNGFTLYQASFSSDETGKPVATVLSVNRDPGRVWKYLGSLLVCLGSVLLFYFRKYYIKETKVVITK